MTDSAYQQFSRRERQIMDIIYALGEASATQVVNAMPDPPSRTAVRTMLRILEDKGQLKHEKRGREFVYQPTRPRTKEGRSALRRVLHTFFDGSLEKAVAVHLSDPDSGLTADELRRLADIIREAGKEEGEP